jgi:hypothetical protein
MALSERVGPRNAVTRACLVSKQAPTRHVVRCDDRLASGGIDAIDPS